MEETAPDSSRESSTLSKRLSRSIDNTFCIVHGVLYNNAIEPWVKKLTGVDLEG